MKDLLKKPLPAIPADIQERLNHPNITLTAYENKNDVLTDPALQQEVGIKQFPGRKLAGVHVLSHAWYHQGDDRLVVLVAYPGGSAVSGLVPRFSFQKQLRKERPGLF